MKASEFLHYTNKPLYKQILEKVSQEEIFQYYLGVPVTSKKIINPLRKDNSPGCFFMYNDSGWLRFYDYTWSEKGFNCFDLVSYVYSIPFGETVKKINEDLFKSYVKNPIPAISNIEKEKLKSRVRDFKIKVRPFRKEEIQFFNIGGLNLTEEELNQGGWFAVEKIWAETYYGNLSFTFAFIEEGIVKQLYFPKNKGTDKMRFRNQHGLRMAGLEGLFEANHVVITKSAKDTFYLRLFGINAFYVINEKVLIEKELMDELHSRFTHVFTLFDNDYTGKKLTVRYYQTYSFVIPLLYSVGEGKDTSEVLEYMEKNYLLDLIEDLKQRYEL